MKPLSYILLFFFSLNLQAQDLYFPPLTGNQWETTDPSTLNWCPERIDSLTQFLEDKNSKAFIILKDGKIVLEEYFDDFTQDSIWYWASAGKTVTAFITGLTQQSGQLNLDDPTSDYLGEGWTSLPPADESQMTIRHQLSMTTGLDDGTGDVDCTDPDCLQYLATPGERWAYHNAPYTLLTNVNEAARGQTINQIVYSDLNDRIGLGGAYVPLGFNRVFFSKPRGMARFGLLILNNGSWDSDVLMIDQQYFTDMVNTSQQLNLSYGYLWWLNGKGSYMLPSLQTVFQSDLVPNAPDDMFAALGKNDQKIYVVPSQNMVVIRMGESAGQSLFALSSFDNQLWEKINELECTASNTNEVISNENIRLHPNPVNDILYVDLKEVDGDVQISLIDVSGKVVAEYKNTAQINVSGLLAGVYFVKVKTGDYTRNIKIVKK